MEYYVADTYKSWDRTGKPYNKNGKLYTKVKETCGRCNGTGIAISHVENGRPIPYTPDGGMCYCCEGKGSREKEVRLYTESEYKKMTAINEANRIKKAAALEKKIKAEYEEKRLEWLSKEGFTEEGKTFVALGDTYAIKDELKAEGFKFNNNLKWHRAYAGERECVEVDINDIADATAWGNYTYKASAKKYVEDLIESLIEIQETEYYGEVGEKIINKEVTVKGVRSFEGRYGISHIYTFEADNNIFVWFSNTIQSLAIGDIITLSGTIKAHEEYKNIYQTILTRCSIAY